MQPLARFHGARAGVAKGVKRPVARLSIDVVDSEEST
jgi:hypothetical protein